MFVGNFQGRRVEEIVRGVRVVVYALRMDAREDRDYTCELTNTVALEFR